MTKATPAYMIEKVARQVVAKYGLKIKKGANDCNSDYDIPKARKCWYYYVENGCVNFSSDASNKVCAVPAHVGFVGLD